MRLRDGLPGRARSACVGRRGLFADACSCWPAWRRSRCCPAVGQDFFPAVDSGQFKLHVRAPTGTRIEETAVLCDRVERVDPRRRSRRTRSASIIDNIGLPYSGLNLSYSNSAPIGAGDADILVALTEDHRPTADYIHELRDACSNDVSRRPVLLPPADIVSQILNFGLPAPIDVQVVGRNQRRQPAVRRGACVPKLARVPGIVDLRMQQVANQPTLAARRRSHAARRRPASPSATSPTTCWSR